MTKRDPIRYWGGAIGAAALVVAIVVAIVVQTRSAKPQTAAQAPARTQAAIRTQAAVRPQVASKPQATVKPLTDVERKMSEELWVEQKKLDTDSARVAATPDGRRRLAETIAKQFNFSDKLVNDLRGRKLGYGEITAALALSQQLMKRDSVTRQQALERVLTARKAGQGWGAIARGFGLKLGDVLGDVKKTDKQLVALAAR
jgi:high-affinity Fe2+/Pb2+ permease